MDHINRQPNQQLLYEVNMYRRKVDLEITSAEQQLASVEGRLKRLKQDLFVYLGFIIVPHILRYIFDVLTLLFFSPLTYIIFSVASFLTVCIFVILLVPSIYNLTKTIILLYLNRESDEPVNLPPAETAQRGGLPPEEESYREERDKLMLVLSRYYVYRDRLERLHEKIKSGDCNMTMVELEHELKQMPIFVDIQPANPRTGVMGAKVNGTTKKIMCAIVLVVVIAVLIGIIV